MKALLITAGVVVVALVTAGVLNFAGVFALRSNDGHAVAAQISAELSSKLAARVSVTCPVRIPEKRSGIEDCQANAGHGTTLVRLIQEDSYGHFHYVVNDPTVLMPAPAPENSSEPTSAETDFGQACIGFGGDPAQCACIYGQLAAHRGESDVRRAAESYRQGDGLPEDLAAAADACRRGA